MSGVGAGAVAAGKVEAGAVEAVGVAGAQASASITAGTTKSSASERGDSTPLTPEYRIPAPWGEIGYGLARLVRLGCRMRACH
jgi:hypothetical protein